LNSIEFCSFCVRDTDLLVVIAARSLTTDLHQLDVAQNLIESRMEIPLRRGSAGCPVNTVQDYSVSRSYGITE